VDAPSTPISSAIATRSAGVFFFSSFKCMGIVFSWGVVLELVENRLKAAKRQDAAWEKRNGDGELGNWPGPLSIRGMSGDRPCQSAVRQTCGEKFRMDGRSPGRQSKRRRSRGFR